MTYKQALVHFYNGEPIRRKDWYYRYSIIYNDGAIYFRDVLAGTDDFRFWEYSLDEISDADKRKRDWELWKPIQWKPLKIIFKDGKYEAEDEQSNII